MLMTRTGNERALSVRSDGLFVACGTLQYWIKLSNIYNSVCQLIGSKNHIYYLKVINEQLSMLWFVGITVVSFGVH